MKRLSGKTAVVTGASSGIGYEAAKRLAEEGASVMIIGRDNARCQKVAEEFRSAGGIAEYRLIELYDETAPARVIEAVRETFGHLDILVNNAAWWTNEPFLSVSRENFRRGFSDYMASLFFLSQAAAQAMIDDHISGKIIHIASTAAFYGERGMSVYCAAKSALVNLTRAMALELGEYGICVNAVAPGTTVTNNEKRPAHVLESFRKMGALPELNTAAKIAPSVAFLASADSDGITGETLCVDGGCVQIRMPEKLYLDPISYPAKS